MALNPESITITPEDIAAADAAEKKIDAALPSRREQSITIQIGKLSHPALCEVATRYRGAGWHVDTTESASGASIKLTAPFAARAK